MLTTTHEMEVMVKVKSDIISTDVCPIEAVALPKELGVIFTNSFVKHRGSNKK